MCNMLTIALQSLKLLVDHSYQMKAQEKVWGGGCSTSSKTIFGRGCTFSPELTDDLFFRKFADHCHCSEAA